jgi:hypothetical protein
MKKEKSTKNKFLRYFLFILLLGLMVVFYSYFIGTKGLKVREYGVINNKIPESFDGFKVVQFSDLHYGTTIKDEEVDKIVSEINNLKPDLVVFTGDLIDVHYDISDEEIESLSNALNNIEATIGKYIVRGNHDVNPGFEKVLQNIDFIDLDNQNTFIYYNDNAPIVLVGLDDYLEHTIDIEKAFNYDNEDNYYTILIAHEPDVIDQLNDYSIDLVLSGHSHNGQVRLPLIGAIYTTVGAKKYYDEMYEINDTTMYISGGLGTSKAPFRFLVKPSFNFYRFYSN